MIEIDIDDIQDILFFADDILFELDNMTTNSIDEIKRCATVIANRADMLLSQYEEE